MTFKRSVGSFFTVSFSSWQIATRSSFWSWVNTLGTNFVAIRCMFSCSVRIRWQDPQPIPTSALRSCMVRRRSRLTAARTCSTFEGVVAVLARPDWSSLAVDVLPFLKPLKRSATAHARITKSLFQHFKSFTSRFTQSHTELDAHPSFVNFRHTVDIRTSQTAGAIHAYRHVQQSNASTSNHATGHTHSQDTTAIHPSGKIVNYKRSACYEHCPGTFGYTFV